MREVGQLYHTKFQHAHLVDCVSKLGVAGGDVGCQNRKLPQMGEVKHPPVTDTPGYCLLLVRTERPHSSKQQSTLTSPRLLQSLAEALDTAKQPEHIAVPVTDGPSILTRPGSRHEETDS